MAVEVSRHVEFNKTVYETVVTENKATDSKYLNQTVRTSPCNFSRTVPDNSADRRPCSGLFLCLWRRKQKTTKKFSPYDCEPLYWLSDQVLSQVSVICHDCGFFIPLADMHFLFLFFERDGVILLPWLLPVSYSLEEKRGMNIFFSWFGVCRGPVLLQILSIVLIFSRLTVSLLCYWPGESLAVLLGCWCEWSVHYTLFCML